MSAGDLPKKGDIIAGKYQVEDVLGAGGMGIVVAARHMALRRRVAVKFLLPQAARLPDASARFMREARAAVALQTEHVARVLDVGSLENGAPYMVMEFLAGTDFARMLKDRGPLPVADAMDYIIQAGEAIAEAHALGIVHRDLKPGNIFMTTRAEGSPLVKVLDFGLSKMAADDGSPEGSLTATGFVAGSPYYMAPEQIRSLKNVDWRADIWALGVILYEMLTVRRPFEGPSLTAVCASIVADTPISMRALRADVPEAIEAAVMACLEKATDRRMSSVAELAQAIAPFAPARSMEAVERIVRLLPGTGTAPMPVLVEAEAVPTVALPVLAPAAPAADDPRRGPQPTAVLKPSPAADAPTTGPASAWGSTGPLARGTPLMWIVGAVAALIAVGTVIAIGAPRAPSSAVVASSTTVGTHTEPPVITASAMLTSATTAPTETAPSATLAAAVPSPPSSQRPRLHERPKTPQVKVDDLDSPR